MSKAWFVRADYTVYADDLESAIEKWHKHTIWPNETDVVFDGFQDVYENEWSNNGDS